MKRDLDVRISGCSGFFRVFGTEVVRLLAWTEPASRKKREASEVEASRLCEVVFCA
ncbi:hypothetical protein [Cupriavidus basilensis]|uniref:hypothetical protein n=1 Tax=Cupriavidus basilensis TaxID=68895 RepID=UPI0039F67CE4